MPRSTFGERNVPRMADSLCRRRRHTVTQSHAAMTAMRRLSLFDVAAEELSPILHTFTHSSSYGKTALRPRSATSGNSRTMRDRPLLRLLVCYPFAMRHSFSTVTLIRYCKKYFPISTFSCQLWGCRVLHFPSTYFYHLPAVGDEPEMN